MQWYRVGEQDIKYERGSLARARFFLRGHFIKKKIQWKLETMTRFDESFLP